MDSPSHLETDLLVIGGGINGVGIAADAAGRGLSVILCEKGDLAQGTSSASTKLIHGGLRYLENYDFLLVRQALHEREILLKSAPYLIRPITFVLPHEKHLRPVWMIQLGLFLYDHLAHRAVLPASKKINLKKSIEGIALQPEFNTAFIYSDCRTDDARLVVTNALAAQQHGAHIFTRTKCLHAERYQGKWRVACVDQMTQKQFTIVASAIVNATGPWANQILTEVFQIHSPSRLHLIKGSHIVVPKLYDGEHAYILQQSDQRIIFVIPYQENFSLIGTTELNYHDSLDTVTISREEIDYLIRATAKYFTHKIIPEDVIWSYSGVRPLYGDPKNGPSAISREYHLEVVDDNHQAPLLTVFGGKLTTYRTLAEHALKLLKPYFPRMGNAWTAHALLPGGDTQTLELKKFIEQLQKQYQWLPASLIARFAKSYGTLTHQILKGATQVQDLGKEFGAGLYEKEIIYLIEHEWAITLDDILWRRSKLGLFLTNLEKKQLGDYLAKINMR